MFYAATNSYATESSIGFSNTWGAIAFESKSTRDDFVKSSTDLATRAITKKEVPGFITRKPRPFTEESYVIVDERLGLDKIAGYVGAVVVGDMQSPCYVCHLNAK